MEDDFGRVRCVEGMQHICLQSSLCGRVGRESEEDGTRY